MWVHSESGTRFREGDIKRNACVEGKPKWVRAAQFLDLIHPPNEEPRPLTLWGPIGSQSGQFTSLVFGYAASEKLRTVDSNISGCSLGNDWLWGSFPHSLLRTSEFWDWVEGCRAWLVGRNRADQSALGAARPAGRSSRVCVAPSGAFEGGGTSGPQTLWRTPIRRATSSNPKQIGSLRAVSFGPLHFKVRQDWTGNMRFLFGGERCFS